MGLFLCLLPFAFIIFLSEEYFSPFLVVLFVIELIFVVSKDLFLIFRDELYCEFYEEHVDFYRFGKLIKILYYKDIYYTVEPGPFHNTKYLYLKYKDEHELNPKIYKFDCRKSNRLFFEKIGIEERKLINKK